MSHYEIVGCSTGKQMSTDRAEGLSKLP